MLSQYKCMVNGHDEQLIIGICENINCQQPYRRACFDCYQTHQVNDQQFKMADIMNEKGIQILLDEFLNNNINKINNIYTQCHIQQYFLTLKLIEQVEQYILKYSQLTNILDDLDKFVRKEWKLVSITNYIQAEKNIGIYKYLQQIQDKLQVIDQSKDNYIININNRIINENFWNQINNRKGDSLAQSIPPLIKENDKIYRLIMKNDLCRKEQVNQNLWQPIKDLVIKQGQNLKTNILKQQYNQIEYLISIDGKKRNKQQSTLSQSRVLENEIHSQENKLKSVQYFKEGNSLYNKQKYSEAIEQFDLAIKLDPNYVDAYIYKGFSLHNLQRYQEAVDIYDQASIIDPKDVDAYYNKGLSLHSLQRYQEAIDMYNQAIKLDPKYVKAYNNKGYSLSSLKRYQEAVEMFNQAIKLDPRYVIAYNNKGLSLHSLQRYKEAIDMYGQAIKLDPKYVIAYNNKGQSLHSLQKYKEAIDMYDQAIKLYPKDVNAYYNKGLSLHSLQRYQEAIDMYDQVIKLDPKYVKAYNNKGFSLHSLQRYQEAIDIYDLAIKLNPKYVDVYNNKGSSLLKMGKKQDAQKTFKECLKIDPLNQYANSYLDKS